ncbi:hypothetical protein ACIGHG_06925 [Bacillus sp. NPDC077411]|uniref:Uncharacterized protein n=1 Tax=Bacillus bruguierae TaxID=3127667 RepID=A0ABU8FH10_9BACI
MKISIYVYACRKCEVDEISTPIVTANMPVPVFPKSIASPSIMAYIMTQKYIVYFRITLRLLLNPHPST